MRPIAVRGLELFRDDKDPGAVELQADRAVNVRHVAERLTGQDAEAVIAGLGGREQIRDGLAEDLGRRHGWARLRVKYATSR